MNGTEIVGLLLPLALLTVMFGVGLSLCPDDFWRLKQRPGAILLGVSLQLVMLPVLGVAVVTVFDLPAVLAAGLLILTFAPGGATSNLICFLCRADTALSVSLTVLSGLIIPFSLPLLSIFTLQQLQLSHLVIEFPVAVTIAKLFVISVLPVALGMLCRHRQPLHCMRALGWVKGLAALIMLLVVGMLAVTQLQALLLLLPVLAPAVLTLAGLAMLLAYMLSRGAGLMQRESLTLAIETGIQNAGSSLIITAVILHNTEMSAAVLLYGILMQLPALGLIIWRNLPGRGARNTCIAR